MAQLPASYFICQCSDPACPHCKGLHIDQWKISAVMTLYRVDMLDPLGSKFCEACGTDAMDAGIFTTKETDY